MTKERNYGIDLLRLVLMFMVCVLHTLGQGGVLKMLVPGTASHNVYWLLEVLCYCAVDGFAIISGYMAVDKPKKYSKLADMWFQVFFYSFVVTIILTVLGFNSSMSVVGFIKCAMPVTNGNFWYFTGFFVMFLASPLLNRFLFAIDEKYATKALIVIVVLFSGLGVLTDPFLTHEGNSTIWIIVLYCIGVLAKRIKIFETRKTYVLIIIWAICILLTWGVKITTGIERLARYHSPTILLSGMIMVVLFSRIKLKGMIISKLSPLAFGIYLLQLNQVFWNNIFQDALTFIPSLNIVAGVGLVFAFAAALFVAGLVVEFLRSSVAKLIKLHVLSEKIVQFLNWIMEKLFVLLK